MIHTRVGGLLNDAKYSCMSYFQEELHEIIDLPDADNTPAHMRKQLKSDYEEDVFDDEHYM